MSKLNVLHVSDVHSSFDMISKLQQWMIDKKESLDILLLSGDISDMPMEYGSDTSTEAEKFKSSYYEDMLKVIEELCKIHNNLYYIPGNHDVPKCFEPSAITADSKPPLNVHLQTVSIAPGLSLLGLGGSIPGYKEGKHHWDGFPYTSEDLIQKDLSKLLIPLVQDQLNTDQVILMTHVGPTSSSTTIATDDPKSVIISGSSSLNEWLLNEKIQDKVFMNIHGHTHGGFGESQIGSISVLNPGPLLEGHFSIYTLIQKQVTNDKLKWVLNSVRRFKL